tara:strand:- start:220 stop:489 length:270 start_codon:yes stop_codon:yes gene_type:complete
MKEESYYWHVELERWLPDSEGNKIISKIKYNLPSSYSSMLDSLEMIDEAYHGSVYSDVTSHIVEQFAGSGFLPKKLVSPQGLENYDENE